MATNITDKPMCSICLNEFKEPKILGCNHSFCFTCLEDYINKVSTNNQFPCPLCRHNVDIPTGGVMNFKSNVQQELVSDICKAEIPTCDVCKIVVNSEFRCEDCEQYLCSSCRTTHDGLTICRGHVVVAVNASVGNSRGNSPMSKYKDWCPNHPEKEVRCYCKDCSLSVCAECFVVGHNGHQLLDLQDEKMKFETRETLKQLKVDVEARIEKFANYADYLKALVTDIDQSADKSCEAVDKQVETICSEVKQLGEDVKIQIQKSRDEENDKMTKPLKEMEILIEDLKASVKCTVDVIEDKSIVQVLNRIPQVKQEKKESRLRWLTIPDVKYTWFEQSMIDTTLLIKELGSFESRKRPTFTSSFNLDEVKTQGDVWVFGSDYYIHGLPWCIRVGNTEKREKEPTLGIEAVKTETEDSAPTLGIRLQLSATDGTADIKSCRARYSLTLLNKEDKQQSMDGRYYNTYKPGEKFGNPDFMDWIIFSDKQNGFIDDNNNFTIEATVKVTKIERN